MKKILLLSTAIISLAFTTSNLRKGFKPPGTVQINDTLYCDEAEVSNFSWQEYVYSTINTYGKNSKEHLSTLPDTLVWRNPNTFNESYVSYYYKHPAYRNYPVVGISYDQAVAYCKWRTETAMLFLAIKNKNSYPDFEYRLPSKKEWEMIASSSDYDVNNKQKQYNLNRVYITPIKGDGFDTIKRYTDVLLPVNSLKANSYKLYHTIGNVSEMVLEVGISKGGSWNHKPEESLLGKDILYNQPTAWLGFRCICVVKPPIKNN